MRLIYPAILSKWDDGEGYTIRIPDLKGCVSEGDTLEEAIAMGTDAACGYVITELNDGNKIPKPSKQSKFKLKKNELSSLIICDTEKYDEKYSNKVVRKNISIPAYLNTFGELHNVNFSKLLKESLMKIACV